MTVSTKILRTFVFAFLGIFLTGLVNILADVSKTGDWSVAKTAVVSLVLAAVSAAVRAIVAYLPILADDQVGIQKKP